MGSKSANRRNVQFSKLQSIESPHQRSGPDRLRVPMHISGDTCPALGAIARKAIDRKTGARGLRRANPPQAASAMPTTRSGTGASVHSRGGLNAHKRLPPVHFNMPCHDGSLSIFRASTSHSIRSSACSCARTHQFLDSRRAMLSVRSIGRHHSNSASVVVGIADAANRRFDACLRQALGIFAGAQERSERDRRASDEGGGL
jgi:hypothetical protein